MRNVHLLVLIHGMWGNPEHLAEMSRIIKETKGLSHSSGKSDANIELDVLLAQTNRDESTYDGIDWGGERVADEVDARVREIETSGGKVVKFSISGYSLGGLVARYVIGILLRRSFFKAVQPVNFTTFATPHIGLLRTSSVWSSLFAVLGPKLLSRTGEQFYAVDMWGSSERSLLEVMANRKEIFYQALSLFTYIRIYGNAVNDTTVPYATALIEASDPFVNRAQTGINVEFDRKYDPIILSYTIPDSPPVKIRPKPFSPTWFRSIEPTRYLPPPLRTLKFPINAIAVLLLPVLIPVFITLIVVRLSLHARSSRARIRLLEGDEQGRESKLVNMFARLERSFEGAVVEMAENDVEVDDNTGAGAEQIREKLTPPNTKSKNINTSISTLSTSAADADADTPRKPEAGQPLLTPAQLAMVRSLNALPQLTKHRAYIDLLRNSHAAIIARDVAGFTFHRRGWGVLQHWADAFEL
ncbi:hypothetical protein EW145_g6225 [Phellinidium pouzarii]|uniref:DUF676 domain-containing protein n=1 Tax=Phellinidium pouzarii TaxID=167371 RepID=A0A4S4KXC7_9AGAM|nr:hypothetical protein EW145_g6225 [Phellinidium pouzarii]